jgi:cytochrome P450
VTSSPANIHAILSTQFSCFEIGEGRRRNFDDLFGYAILTADGEDWVRFRGMLKGLFAREGVEDLSSKEAYLGELWEGIGLEDRLGKREGTYAKSEMGNGEKGKEKQEEGDWETVDLAPLFSRYTIDTSTAFLFGISVSSQKAALAKLSKKLSSSSSATSPSPSMSPKMAKAKPDENGLDFQTAVHHASLIIVRRGPLQKFYYLYSPPSFKRACAYVRSIADGFVSQALASFTQNSLSGEKKKFVLLDHLLETTKDPKELRDQVLHVLLAGNQATAGLLSWVILLLSRHPDEFERVRAAALSVFASQNSGIEITAPKLRQVRELQNVLLETLRLYPFIPCNERVVKEDCVLPDGGEPGGEKKEAVAVRGELVVFSIYHMQRRKDVWGEDAESWRPGRWEEGRERVRGDFAAFGAGPRVCLGRKCSSFFSFSFDFVSQHFSFGGRGRGGRMLWNAG